MDQSLSVWHAETPMTASPCSPSPAILDGASRSILYDGSNANRISMDQGHELSRIRPRHSEQLNSIDSDERNDLESYGLNVQADASSSYLEKGLE